MNFHQKFLNSLNDFKDAGVTCMSHVLTLALLARTPAGLRMVDLAEGTSLSSAAMTGTIDTLEKMRLVERVRSATDRRSIVIMLTSTGRHLLQTITVSTTNK